MEIVTIAPASYIQYLKEEDALPDGWVSSESIEHLSLQAIAHDLTGKRLWRELFLSVHTEKELQAWKGKIPKYGCSCFDFYVEYERYNPPTFPLPFRWKYDLKAAVNSKLNHKNLTYDEAFAFWTNQK